MNKLGVIDLGTNTFHLLIAEPNEANGFCILYRERHFVKLAEDGIGRIGPAAFARGLRVMEDFKTQLETQQVSFVRAIGTAALRTAENGREFIREVYSQTGISVELIDGNREAELIYKGVMQAIPPIPERIIIMDIGGGSVEFIICDQQGVRWVQSFPIGVAILWKRFHKSDPIAEAEVEQIQYFLNTELAPLREALRRFPTRTLVGASGTFDVLENILVKTKTHPYHSQLTAAEFPDFYRRILNTTFAERLQMEGMPAERADMIVAALVLLNHVLLMADIHTVHISVFALKEGVLYEMLQQMARLD